MPRRCRAPAASDAARAIMTTDTVPKEAVATRRARRPSAAWPRARRCCRRRWRRCSRSSRPTPRSIAPRCSARWHAPSRETFDCLDVDGAAPPTTPCSCSRTVAPAQRRPHALHRRAHRGVRRRSPNRWRATPKVRRSSCASRVVGARTDADARLAARGVANSQLVQCSLNGDDPYWGRILSELGASGALPRSRAGRHLVQRRRRVPRRHRVRPRRAPRSARAMAAPDIEIRCDLRLAHGEATMLTTDLSHAYIDENRRTS